MTSLRRLAFALFLSSFVIAATPAEAQIRLHGTLLGADGEPMRRAHVVVQDGPIDTTLLAAADEAGRFSLELPEPGGYGMYLLGVHHETLEVPLIVTDTEPIELDVRLGTYDYEEAPDTLWVTTAANDYQKQGATPMAADGDAFVATVPVEADTLAYQVIGFRKSLTDRYAYTVSGTEADRYAFHERGPFWDSESDYIAVAEGLGGGPAEVRFEPDALPPPGQEPLFRSENLAIEEIARIYLETEAMERRLGQESMKYRPLFEEVMTEEERAALRDSVGELIDQFTRELAAPIRQRIEREEHPLLRQWLVLRYFDELRATEADSALARWALEAVPPTSPFWSFEAWSSVGASNLIVKLARQANAPALVNAYVDRVIAEHPDPDVRRQFLSVAIYTADEAGDEKRKMRYYAEMMAAFGETRDAKRIRRRYAPEKAVQRGNLVPAFALEALGDSSVVYTDEGMRGQVYLIDAWAVWCGPCIAEMDELHEAYEAYQEEGFEILSISFDEAVEDVEAFRRERWPMPWKHHFAGFSGAGREAIEETFEVVGIPHPILVGADGRILATEEVLRGEKLLEELERAFEEE